MSLFTAALVSGVLLGAIYALVAAGLNLIFGVVKVINFAHGAMLMLGMYITYWLVTLGGLDPYLSLPIVVLAMAAIGYVIQIVLINPVMKSERTSQLLITFGLALALENGAVVLWSYDYRSIDVPYAREAIEVFGIRFTVATLIAMGGAAIALLILYLFLNRTRIGTSIRAVSQQPDSAELVGIDVRRTYAYAFAASSALVGAAAVFMVPIYYVQPQIGEQFGIMAFIIVVLGGLGNVWGAAIAGLLLGIVQNVFGTMVNVQMATSFVFLVFILVMLVRPYGLFGRTGRLA